MGCLGGNIYMELHVFKYFFSFCVIGILIVANNNQIILNIFYNNLTLFICDDDHI